MTKSKAANRILGWVRKVLLGAGLAGVALWLASNAVPAVWQYWDNWVFDHEVLGQPASFSDYVAEKQQQITGAAAGWLGIVTTRVRSLSSNHSPAPPITLKNNALIGRLTIPRLNLISTVREGTGEDILSLAAGHIRGTALPGGSGNVAVAGHRDTLFSGLARIRNNDVIDFETLRGSYQYQVESTQIVAPQDVCVLKARPYSELTLVTCYPFDYIGPAPKRFIVRARQVSSNRSQKLLADETSRAKLEPVSVPPQPVRPSDGKEPFYISRRHSQQLAPGISIGVDEIDAVGEQMNGWLWIMPDRRTIWLRGRVENEPLIFYQNGERRELTITSVSGNTVTGYLRLHGVPAL
jgi:sortase A